jgi:hypothetical protein
MTLLTPDQIIASSCAATGVNIGIYFLIRDGKVVYVGQSIHIALRVAIHAQTRRFDSWSWVPCEIDSLSKMERSYLDAFLPEENMDLATRTLRGDFKTAPVYTVPVNEWASITPEQWAICKPTEEEEQEERTRAREWKLRMDRYRGYDSFPKYLT